MRKTYFGFLISIIYLVFLNCSIDEPVLPRWKTPYVIPLIKETIVFAEELGKDSTVTVKGDSLYIELSGKFDPDTLTSQDLSVDGADSTSTFSLDKISLDSLGTISTGEVGVSTFIPSLPILINQTVPFPDTTISGQAIISDSSAFRSMKVNNGNVYLTIYNNLPFTISPDPSSSNSLEISIFNQDDRNHVTDVVFTQTILPGTFATASAPLGSGDGWVTIPLQLDFQFHVDAETIFITQDSLDAWNMQLDLLFQDLEIEEITGRVPSQGVGDTLRVGIDHDDQVIEARIDSGTIQIRFFNQLPLSAQLLYIIPDIVNINSGQPYTGQVFVASGDSATTGIQNLAGYRILNSQAPGQPIDTFTVYIQAATDTGWVTLSAQDEISARVTASRILFSYIRGVLAPDSLVLEPRIIVDIADYGELTSGIAIQGVQLILGIENQLNIQNLQMNGVITGYKKDPAGQYTDSAKVFIQNQTLIVGRNDIYLQGPDVDALINIYPSDLKAEGNIAYSGMAEVTAGDTLGGDYILTSPFWIQITNADPITVDPDTVTEIDENLKDAIKDTVLQYALLRAKVLNAGPVSGMLDIFFSADPSRQDLFDTTGYGSSNLEFFKTVNVAEAVVNPSTGFVTEPTETEFLINLNIEELQVFVRLPFRVGIKLNLDDTNGFVILRGSDYVEFSGIIETEVLFKEY
jgi:hypothetical protein